MIKTLLVYAHLIAACLAVGVLLIQDLVLVKWQGRAMDIEAIENLQRNSGIVGLALVALWVTGLIIVSIGFIDNPAYLMNQKLWAKFSVVSILTINGLFLHFYSFPRLMAPQGFLGANTMGQFVTLVTAVVSLVSWLYACYLGIARPWNNVATYAYVMTIYIVIFIVSLLVALECWRGLRSGFRSVVR